MTAIHSMSHDTEVLLDLLSQLSSSQLAIAVTQHSSLPDHISTALRQLAALSISEPGSITNGSKLRQCKNIASIVRKLVSRGDPSLVRKLLPSQSSLIDFALCTNAKDLLARLVDETEAIEYIRVASLAFQRARNDKVGSKEDQLRRITKAARILACIVSVMPSRRIIEDKLTRGQRERGSEESTLICSTVEALRLTYESMTAEKGIQDNESLPVLQAKVSLIDATWFLVERMFLFISKSTKQTTSKEADGLLQALCGSNPLHQGSMPLVDLSLAVDLALVRPLRNTIKSEVRQYSSAHLTVIEEVIKEAGYESGEVRQMSKLGSAWSLVIASLTLPKSNGKPPAALVEAVLAVLPYLEGDRPGLEKRLSTSTYAGKDAETVIQLLLEEDEGNKEEDYAEVDEAMDPAAFEDVEALRILQERANVFTDQELEGVKMTRGKARAQDVDLSSGLSADIRAAILARAEEPESDREEEWNPFSDAAFEVGFEEEMDEEMNERERPAVVGLRSPDEGEEDEDEDDEDDDEVEEGEQDGERGASGHGSGSKAVNEVASERAAERILISAWSEKGEAMFTKEARKSAFRTNLKAKLADLPGRRWDDGLIESWGTMFARNPRKDKLLASVDDIMRLGNQNIAEPESTAGGQSRYGPDKGRGGRILTGQRGGGQSGGGRGGGRGGRGSARGGRGNRGTKRGGRGAA